VKSFKGKTDLNNSKMATKFEENKQTTMFGSSQFPFYEEILDEYGKEFRELIAPKGDTTFGFWMQTIADLELLNIELQGLTKEFKINSVTRTVKLKGDEDFIKSRVAHLERIKGKTTIYADFIDLFNDSNAYAFHNLYPYKGKFYPRVVRTLANAFGLKSKHLILDPFNGSGTATHEASLMGIDSVGVDVTPIGTMLSELKNELPFISSKDLEFTQRDIIEIFNLIEKKKWEHPNKVIEKLMLVIYFDTIDAFARTSRYNRKGKEGLFFEKFCYVNDCYTKLVNLKNKYNLEIKRATIIESDILELKSIRRFKGKFDAIITSPPYYLSIDYVGKDKIAYDYLGINMKEVEAKYLGMKNDNVPKRKYGKLPSRVSRYYQDLKKSIENMCWALKSGGKIAIIVGDSTVGGTKIPTTIMTKKFCEESGLKFQKIIFNPLLGARNRAIRGESIIICEKKQ